MTESQSDRTRTLLRQLAGNNEVADELFAPGRVVITLGRAEAALPQAQLVASFAVNLLARLFPVVQHLEILVPNDTAMVTRVPRWGAETMDEHLRHLLTELRPPATWRVRDGSSPVEDLTLVIGTVPREGAPSVFVGADGWQIAVSSRRPQPVGQMVNPVGAYAAACFGVSEIWKRLLHPHRELFHGNPVIPLEGTLHFSALTYRASANEPNPSLPTLLDLDRLTIVGLGAGGGAAAYTLATLPDLTGILNLIDPDAVEAPNLNRFVFADAGDARCSRPKPAIVQSLLTPFQNLKVRGFPVAFRDAVRFLETLDFRHVVAAVHSREARRDIQHETPMVLWDAAAEGGEFGVWRMVFGQTECMWCKHPPDAVDPELCKAEQLFQLLGLDRATWLGKVRDNEPFTDLELAGLRLPPEAGFALPLVGQPYSEWDTAQCGKVMFPTIDTSVPVPFAPVLAGVLLAGEVIKEHAFPGNTLDSYYWNTLTGRFMTRNLAHRRWPRPQCPCTIDKAFQTQYTQRWLPG